MLNIPDFAAATLQLIAKDELKTAVQQLQQQVEGVLKAQVSGKSNQMTVTGNGNIAI